MSATVDADRTNLPPVPVISAETGGAPATLAALPERLAPVLAAAEQRYSRAGLRAGDAVSRRWLRRTDNPYLGEIEEVARQIGRPGAVMLNLSYEWSCTSAVGPDPSGPGTRLLRTLDWPLDGLGEALIVTWRRGVAGRFLDITWPGYAGVLSALAPGRFAAVINQPPMTQRGAGVWLDWALNRFSVWRGDGLPPHHLLRRVMETCADYTAAKAMLTETPLCLPAFFTLSGTEAGEGCVIERDETRAAIADAPVAAANHWRWLDVEGHPRGYESEARLEMMETLHADGGSADWLRPPILNPDTRLAMGANAASGRLRLIGIEGERAATAPLDLAAI